MAGVALRRATPDDAALVGGMLHDFNAEFDSPTPSAAELAERFRRLLAREDQLVLLAEERGAAVGFAYLTLRATPYADGPLAQLEELYVRPDRRDRRTGTALLRRAIDLVRDRGAVEMHIDVDEDDADTRRFYEERFGFTNQRPGTDFRMLCYEREL